MPSKSAIFGGWPKLLLKVEQGEGVFKLRNIFYKDVNTAPMLQK